MFSSSLSHIVDLHSAALNGESSLDGGGSILRDELQSQCASLSELTNRAFG